MREGFLTDISTAELFFRFCIRYKINTEKQRILVLREITRRKKAKYLRDAEAYLQDKNVMVVKKEK